MTAKSLQADAAMADISRGDQTIAAAEHLVEVTAVNQGNGTFGKCGVATTIHIPDSIFAAMDIDMGLMARAIRGVRASHWPVVSAITATKHIGYGK